MTWVRILGQKWSGPGFIEKPSAGPSGPDFIEKPSAGPSGQKKLFLNDI